jgi:two-component system, cell cycle sensor histidine kinase and response regulator CckA
MVCAMLTQIGYICLEAADGAEALRVLNGSKQVRLVLTDVMMPNMGGAELAQHLARIRPDVRIIFMSGYADHPVIHRMGAEAAEFLAKPFTASALTDTVRRVLNNGGPASHPG